MRRLGFSCLSTGIATLVAAQVALAQPGLDDPGEQHSRASLVCETKALVPGTSSMLAVVLDLDKGWHSYADSVNDSGSPMLVTWALPDGVEIGEPIWTASHRHVQAGGILDHVYENQAVVMFPLSVTDAVRAGEGTIISASLEWLVCDANRCLPQFAEVSLELPVQKSSDRSADAGLFDQARKDTGKLATGARDDAILINWQGDTLLISSVLGYRLEFIPGPGCAQPLDLIQRGASDTGELELKFDFDQNPRAEVVGWVRLIKPEGKNLPPIPSDLYLVRLERGKGPTRILGGSKIPD